MKVLISALGGYGLDLLLGDPEWERPFHPVVLMGRSVNTLEKLLRKLFPETEKGERAAGRALAFFLPCSTILFCSEWLKLLRSFSRPLALLQETIWCWQALAVKDLKDEACAVRDALGEGLPAARKAVSRIVGRNTENLSEEGVLRAAVETVGENFSDGIVAPMFWMMLGGAPAALGYKAVNTMDSMIGYRNERYLHFGRAAAKLDDAVNFIPARLAALMLAGGALICGEDAAGAMRIRKRDGRAHPSPNSGQCEAAMAGALGLRLSGPAVYFGRRVEKPWIGDAKRNITRDDITRACRLDYVGSALAMLTLGGLRLLAVCLRAKRK